MPPLPHRIRRLSLRVKAASSNQALALRKELRDQLDPMLLTAMERAFDKAGARDALVHLPSVQVRVRISSMDALPGELARCFEVELRRLLSTMPATSEQTSTGFQTTASRQPRARMLVHYLETGSLPWPLAQVDPAVVSELRDVASTGLLEVLDGLTGEPVSLPARVAFWFRWLQLLPDASWPVLARTAAPPSTGQGPSQAEIVGALSGAQASALSRYARLQLAAAAIAWARGTSGLADVGELASIVLHVLRGEGAGGPGGSAWAKRSDGADTSAMSGSGSGARPSGSAECHASGSGEGAGENERTSSPDARAFSDRRGLEEEVRIREASELAARLPEPAAAAFRAWLLTPSGAPHASVGRGGPAEPRTAQPLSAEKPLPPRPEPGLAALPRGTRAPHSWDTDARPAPFGQRVHYAGLVLLHPFLPRFFESTALKQAGIPALSSGVLPRAAALLHLLAVGEEELFEFELGFIKVLLGLPLDAPLPVSEGLLLATDGEEVEALLSAVIEHWRVLKSTSVRGLRGSFLQRPGLLREEAQGFRLQVEPAPFDMLLGQLPWGIGTVKLPWMKRAIFTEWLAP